MRSESRANRIILTDEAHVLRHMRRESRLSLRCAASQMGWSSTYLSFIEHGRVDVPTGHKFEKMLAVYGGMTKKSFVEKVRRYRLEKTISDEIIELIPKLSQEQSKAVFQLVKQFLFGA